MGCFEVRPVHLVRRPHLLPPMSLLRLQEHLPAPFNSSPFRDLPLTSLSSTLPLSALCSLHSHTSHAVASPSVASISASVRLSPTRPPLPARLTDRKQIGIMCHNPATNLLGTTTQPLVHREKCARGEEEAGTMGCSGRTADLSEIK
ncbi:unnamed protein product [Pleuronectes platessa]|uniref:Uncharacterized protein n=1 Tax=Pleuronectes platessa TaxID=8262 RepID=A0A9N7Z921_PLEPL|nr:unnamed protein product [Pleuronectes platessa]